MPETLLRKSLRPLLLVVPHALGEVRHVVFLLLLLLLPLLLLLLLPLLLLLLLPLLLLLLQQELLQLLRTAVAALAATEWVQPAAAGGGGGGGSGRRRSGEGDAGRIGGTQIVHREVTTVSHSRGPNDVFDGAGRRGQRDGTDVVDGGRRGASGLRFRSRLRSPAGTDYSNDGSEAVRAAGGSVDGSDDAGSKRKRAKRGALEADAADAAASAAGAGGLTDSLPPPLLSGAATSSRLSHFDNGNSRPGEKSVQVQGKDGDSTPEGVCPSCGDTPYGLMINCSGCARQYHSSCVPDGQKEWVVVSRESAPDSPLV